MITSVKIKLDNPKFPQSASITDQDGNEIRCMWPIDIHIDGKDAIATLRIPAEVEITANAVVEEQK